MLCIPPKVLFTIQCLKDITETFVKLLKTLILKQEMEMNTKKENHMGFQRRLQLKSTCKLIELELYFAATVENPVEENLFAAVFSRQSTY